MQFINSHISVVNQEKNITNVSIKFLINNNYCYFYYYPYYCYNYHHYSYLKKNHRNRYHHYHRYNCFCLFIISITSTLMFSPLFHNNIVIVKNFTIIIIDLIIVLFLLMPHVFLAIIVHMITIMIINVNLFIRLCQS